MWWVKLGIAFILVTLGVLIAFAAIGNLASAVLSLFGCPVMNIFQPNDWQSRVTYFLIYIISALLLWCIARGLTTWVPQRLFRPDNLHPTVLQRLKKNEIKELKGIIPFSRRFGGQSSPFKHPGRL